MVKRQQKRCLKMKALSKLGFIACIAGFSAATFAANCNVRGQQDVTCLTSIAKTAVPAPTCASGYTQTTAPTWNGTSWTGLGCTQINTVTANTAPVECPYVRFAGYIQSNNCYVPQNWFGKTYPLNGLVANPDGGTFNTGQIAYSVSSVEVNGTGASYAPIIGLGSYVSSSIAFTQYGIPYIPASAFGNASRATINIPMYPSPTPIPVFNGFLYTYGWSNSPTGSTSPNNVATNTAGIWLSCANALGDSPCEILLQNVNSYQVDPDYFWYTDTIAYKMYYDGFAPVPLNSYNAPCWGSLPGNPPCQALPGSTVLLSNSGGVPIYLSWPPVFVPFNDLSGAFGSSAQLAFLTSSWSACVNGSNCSVP